MAAAAGIFSHALTAGQALAGTTATPMDTSTSGTTGAGSSSDASSDSATISANDFLTLLVTEMQNQDPTADTDPNEYIDQLVQVNSLEQLIDINQTLSTGLGSTTGSADTNSATGQAVTAVPGLAGTSLAGASTASATASPLTAAHGKGALSATQFRTPASSASAAQSSTIHRAPGNLSVPGAMPAAKRVAHALDGRTRTHPAVDGLSTVQ